MFRVLFIRLFGLVTCASCVIMFVTIQPLAAIQINRLSLCDGIRSLALKVEVYILRL